MLLNEAPPDQWRFQCLILGGGRNNTAKAAYSAVTKASVLLVVPSVTMPLLYGFFCVPEVGCTSRAFMKLSELETQPNDVWIDKMDAS